MSKCIITYQKGNGDIIIRPCKHDYGKKIGEETSMGWLVLDIHYNYNGNYYRRSDYHRMIRRVDSKRNKIVRYAIRKLSKFA